MSNMKRCSVCNYEIASNAKICVNCGAKNKKPIYKRTWFIVIAVLFGLSIISGMIGTENTPTSTNTTHQSEELSSTTNTTPDATIPSNSLPNGEISSDVTQSTSEPVIEYIEYSAQTLIEDLNSNALKAENTYMGAYVTLTGKLSIIDSDGNYISLSPQNELISFTTVQCFVTDDSQLEKIIEMQTDDIITLKGQITSVGEILGYYLDIHSIE